MAGLGDKGLRPAAHREIFEVLKERIVSLVYEPGEPLNEKELALEFKVSRTPVREALLRLSQMGLVEMRPRVGTFVTLIDLRQVIQAYEVKTNLEALAAQLASHRATQAQIEALFDIIERFDTYDLVRDYSACISEDQEFHRIVRSAAGNPLLIEMLEELNVKTARFLQSIHYVIDDYQWFRDSLYSMAVAIREGDESKARQTTEEHTRKFLSQMSSRFLPQESSLSFQNISDNT
ncbi:MAG: hypothetical protein AVO33_11410 [delta proteobacterium ML8_F1]|nr:MAG: hypothetical protein AVO33_11410 [delta proteobacterium ML8_F1]